MTKCLYTRCKWHGEHTGGIRGLCAVAELQPHWDREDVAGQLTRLNAVDAMDR